MTTNNDHTSETRDAFFGGQSFPDDFEREAMDGYRENPGAEHDLRGIDRQIRKRSGLAKAGPGLVIFPALFVLLSVFVVWKYVMQGPETLVTPKDSTEVAGKIYTDNKLSVLREKVDEAVAIPESSRITPLEIREDMAVMVKREKLEPITSLTANEVGNTQDNSGTTLTLRLRHLPSVYIYDYKTVDYRILRQTAPFSAGIDTLGLAAPFESENHTTNAGGPDIQSVTYFEFLTEAMGKYHSSDFKGAMNDYLTILEIFPGDLNAHFYGGLCAYNLGLWQDAVSHFDEVLHSQTDAFPEGAAWYRALSLEKDGQKDKANEAFQEIYSQGGYYARQAGKKVGM